MIYLGLRNTEKQKIIIDYIRQNDIRHVVIFSGEIGGQIGKKSVRAPSRAFHLDIEEIGRNTELEVIPYQYGADAPNSVSDRTIEQFGWAESIMYRVFYNLLGRIDNSYLIIYNEFMRNKNRSSLEYNCVAKYSTQTEHRLVFEYFPIIDEIEDFMILADLDSGQAYKGIGVNDFRKQKRN